MKKTTKNKKRRTSLSKLFYNDKFVMIFSALTAFVLWIIVSTTSQEPTVFTITDIPVSMPELSNELRFFNTDDLKAEVRISGNTLVVSTVTSSDIYVTASDVSQITKPGEYIVNLVPKKSGVKTDYSFESTVSPSSVEVYVDRYTEKEFSITDKVNIQSVSENCYASPTMFSSQTVTIRGAESVINRIAEVAAVYNFSESLQKTTTQSVPIILYDENQKIIDSDYITMSITNVEATVPVLMTKRVPVEVKSLNIPSGLSLQDSWITLSPTEVYIAAPADLTDSISVISTSEVDFSKIDLQNNKITVDLILPSGCKNLDNVEKAEVQFDMSAMAQKTFTIETFSVINQTEERQATVTSKSLSVTLVGPKNEIYRLNAGDISAVIDMSKRESPVGLTEATVTIKLPDFASSCWAYGTYTATVNVTDNAETGS